MNTININIKRSNIHFLKPGDYQIKLLKCLGYGSYGYVFLTDLKNLTIKINFGDYKEHSLIGIVEYDEIFTVNKIINEKPKYKINCSEYAFGTLLSKKNVEGIDTINIIVNKPEEKQLSSIFKSGKNNKILFFEGNDVLLMPTYVSYYDYCKTLSSTFFKNEVVLIVLLRNLILSVEELKKIGLVNIDVKLNNMMIDDNNNLKIVDFGLVKDISKWNKTFDSLDIDYYLWPKNKCNLSQMISYMLSMIIFEVLFEDKVFILQNKKYEQFNTYLDEFLELTNISTELKHLIYNSLKHYMSFEEFKEKFNNFFKKYEGMHLTIPNLYHYVLYNKGVDIYSLIKKNKQS